MALATTRLEIVSPDKVVYSEDVRMVIVRSTGGELGILPKHAPPGHRP
ncbi:F-type H+-transporting ATPase subunit epsilon [Selenomonas sp. KH1T6]|nr:F-type H+-transporting ATPase subunit epsilon [Selenomonas ruminantium]